MHWGLNVPRERISSRAVWHRLDELHQVIPQHGCISAEPASVSPGEVIVVGFEECASSDIAACPMNDRTAVAIQNAAQIVEGAAHIDVRNIDVPMLVGMRGLLETSTLARRLTLPSREQPGLLQYPPNAGGADRHDVSVQHHKRQSPIAFQGMFPVEADDRLLLPGREPEITRNPTVVFIDPSVAFSPFVELAGSHAQPVDESSGADLGLFRPAPDEIHHLVPHIVRYPHFGQSSPRFFFRRCARQSVRPTPRLCSGSFFPETLSAVLPLGDLDGSCPGRRPHHSRRAPSANGRTPLAAAPVHHTDRKPAPYPTSAVSGWQPSLAGVMLSLFSHASPPLS